MWTGLGDNVRVRIDAKVEDKSAQRADACCEIYKTIERAKSPPTVQLTMTKKDSLFVQHVTDTVQVVTPKPLSNVQDALPYLQDAVSPKQAFRVIDDANAKELKHVVCKMKHHEWRTLNVERRPSATSDTVTVMVRCSAGEDKDTLIQIRIFNTLCVWKRGLGDRQSMVFEIPADEAKKTQMQMHVCVDGKSNYVVLPLVDPVLVWLFDCEGC